MAEAFDKNPELNMMNVKQHELICGYIEDKVKKFIIDNPVSSAFLRREKGRLPYSVFKATANEIKFIKSQFKGRPPTAFF